jgi:hypothetical protein
VRNAALDARELELHHAWKQHTAAAMSDAPASVPLSLPPIGQPHGVASSLWSVPPPPPPLGDDAQAGGEAAMAAHGPLRPWGKRSKDLKNTRRTPSSYLRASS